ncbi:B3 domain-containing protein REM20-like [Salvia hispanica]|uniref:B3 domain-containing protein REM20-like n=1 Tax=Salvia hispanica TaxID=49212 RepID=UPI0020093BDE|nr:B3 domain-containing protein REM20-like [Salvia hispanica]
MANNGDLDYFRLPTFFKTFSEDNSMDELRIPLEFVANHGVELPFDYRLVMPKSRQWRVRLLRIASGCHFHAEWADFRIVNNIVHNDFLTFTMVDVGVFHVKRYKPNTGCPPLSDLQTVAEDDSDHSVEPDGDTDDDYEPSEQEIETSDDDDCAYDRGVVDVDGFRHSL